MFKFLKMQDYTIEKRSLKDGFQDLLTSTKDIGNNLKNFSIIVFIFIAIAILKDFMLASTVVENYDHQNQNSLMLQGQGDFGYIFYLISFFIVFMTYFFTIDAFSQIKEGIFIKDSLKFSLTKLLDYRVYLICFTMFLSIMISLKIVSIPVFDAIPDASLDDLIVYAQGILSNYDGVNPESVTDFVASNEMHQYINNGLGSISEASLISHFILGALVLVIAIVTHFTLFINIVLYHGMSLFEAIKSSLYFNVVNGGYLMVVTIGLIGFSVLTSMLTNVITNAYFSLILSSFIGAYAIYLFTWIISSNTKEKK